MRNIGAILLVVALLAIFMLPGMGGPAAKSQGVNSADLGPIPGATGTLRAVFPVMFNPPTNTPTSTPTSTPTATHTAVATPTRTGVPGSALTGRLIFVEPKTRYFTNNEWIKFWEQIYNPTGNPIAYTLLGVNVWKDDFPLDTDLGFHTSWTGAPDWISAGCWGPNGNTDWNTGHRCAPSQNEGFHQDHVGEASNIEITTPGHYYIVFWACLSSHAACTGGGAADWRPLGAPLHFDADPATPVAHSALSATTMPQTTCFLITDDPDNIYLNCKDGLE